MPAQCTTPSCDAVSVLITLAQLAQFLPQHWSMMSKQTAVGISPYLLFFNSLYTLLAAIDIIILESHQTLNCSASTYRCIIQAQPLIQMVGSAILCIGMWYWFLMYHHHTWEADPEEQRLFSSFFYNTDPETIYQAFLAASAIFCLLPIALLLTSGLHSDTLTSYAYFCGMLSALLNAIMWIPQIIVTATFGHSGALSLAWVFASVVMDVTLSAYLASTGSHWTIWANNVPDGVQTTILLVLVVRLDYRDYIARRDHTAIADPEQGALQPKKAQITPLIPAQ